ncbi:MAG: hypothetical protein HN509_02260 [Halobacteriovoraceae bacterium]|jgi:spore photoproduct lyase|nr:hypothetical protein [Halobacteriovoraceae bacterium]MBT5095726.1 hypothetical protein [Halobacteriovoraceae bacterium]
MFDKIFIEEEALNHPKTLSFLKKFPSVKTKTIDSIDQVFGKVRKPYLQKRHNLNAFLGFKKGQLIKEAPPAYGLAGEPHYYFIHQYNCIYECDYCYLQGYFNSPDLVFFLNHEEVGNEIKKAANKNPERCSWFHAGEFSDSLALSHLTGELPYYFELFKQLPQAKLEFRTKSANITELLKLPPLKNVITSFSLSPEKRIQSSDLKTPPLKHRLLAIQKLHQAGHPIAIHFDPIIYSQGFEEQYCQLIEQLISYLPASAIQYISVGVVRFPKDIFHQVKRNYPKSDLHSSELIKSDNGLIRYPRPMRRWILSKVKELLLQAGVAESGIYLCMED